MNDKEKSFDIDVRMRCLEIQIWTREGTRDNEMDISTDRNDNSSTDISNFEMRSFLDWRRSEKCWNSKIWKTPKRYLLNFKKHKKSLKMQQKIFQKFVVLWHFKIPEIFLTQVDELLKERLTN